VTIYHSLRAGSGFRPHAPCITVSFPLLTSCNLRAGNAFHLHELCRGKVCPLPTFRSLQTRIVFLRRALCSRACHPALPYWGIPQLRMADIYRRGLLLSASSGGFLLAAARTFLGASSCCFRRRLNGGLTDSGLYDNFLEYVLGTIWRQHLIRYLHVKMAQNRTPDVSLIAAFISLVIFSGTSNERNLFFLDTREVIG
jgi:hypothetical protein